MSATRLSQKTKIIALGIIEDEHDNVLISQRFDPEFPDAHLKWDFIGGTNEFGESLEKTLIREVKEEAGLEVGIIELLPKTVSKTWEHKDYLQHTLIFCYRCKVIGGTLHNGDKKIQDLKWIKRSAVASYPFLSTTDAFIKTWLHMTGS